MKKSLIIALMSISMLASCNNGEKEAQQKLAEQQAINDASREELQTALAERDELIQLMSEITANVNEIKDAEKIISINTGLEGNQKNEINSNLAAIKAALAERRDKLAALEKKLKDSKLSNSNLLNTIEEMKKQISEQEATIENLTAQLENANKRISQLDNTVDSLNTTVQTVTDERNQAQQEAKAQADLANECFFAVGSKKELKEHDILESGFLRKTKIMQSDFDKDYFTKADKRTLTTIPLHSNKAKVITTAQPSSSYEIVDNNGQKVLRILNPTEFWGTSNYVVIQID